MGAVADTADRRKFIAYGLLLANGATAGDVTQNWQMAVADTIRDLRPQHLALLERFTWAADRLGFPVSGRSADAVPEYLEESQLEKIAADLPALPSLIAVLQRRGLIVNKSVGGSTAAFFAGGGSANVWQITPFGEQVHRLMLDIGQRLQ
jgi:hypothetical protein